MQDQIKIGYDRVTDVLSPFSGMDKIPEDILNRAAERGTLVHELCDQRIEGFDDLFIPDHVQGYIDSFSQWHTDDRVYVKNPGRLYCDTYMITGESDCIYADDNDGLVLVDFKTSANEGKTWHLQGSAYKHLLRKEGYTISRIEFVKLDKDGKKPISYFYEDSIEEFEVLWRVYCKYFKNKKGAPKKRS